MEGVILCAHGSRSKKAVEEFITLAEQLRTRLANKPFSYGFLEFAEPRIEDGLNELVKAGCSEIKALPGMLFAAGHVKNDVPSVLREYETRNQIKIRFGRELGVDPLLLEASVEQIKQALGKHNPHQTALVVVGRGSSDPDANSNVAKVCRLLWECTAMGWGEIAYSGVTFPSVTASLEKVAKMGFSNVVVFPYFLFSGILIDRIYRQTDEAQALMPHINFIKADYIGLKPQIAEAFLARLEEIDKGSGNMNCQLCKYRNQLPSFEDEKGLPQQAHHFHVEAGNHSEAGHTHAENSHSKDSHNKDANGGNTSSGNTHNRNANGETTHSHNKGTHNGDGGHHHPYPHSNHPLGPNGKGSNEAGSITPPISPPISTRNATGNKNRP